MKLRLLLILFVAALVSACAGATDAPEADTAAAPAEPAVDPDHAALMSFAEELVTHYNLHHPSMVADFYTDDAITLPADGSVNMGKEAIAASLEEFMAASPTLSVEPADFVVVGDRAVGRGSYGLEMTPEGGEAVSFAGSWMATYVRVDGDWKSNLLITNYNTDPPEGLPEPEPGGEAPEELMDGPAAELLEYYATHFNMGHASMVADVFDEDAVSALANLPVAEGRAAIETTLEERMAEGSPQLTIHDVGAEELGDGWVVDGGWYEVTATTDEGDIVQTGAYMILCRPAEDGSMKIHWAVSNGRVVSE